jgi:hypothetical protein
MARRRSGKVLNLYSWASRGCWGRVSCLYLEYELNLFEGTGVIASGCSDMRSMTETSTP